MFSDARTISSSVVTGSSLPYSSRYREAGSKESTAQGQDAGSSNDRRYGDSNLFRGYTCDNC